MVRQPKKQLYVKMDVRISVMIVAKGGLMAVQNIQPLQRVDIVLIP
jgi:hypothetical protein